MSLFTKEYFKLTHDRLAEGGIASSVVAAGGGAREYDVRSIISSFCAVFQDCSLWNGTVFDWMLVGTRGLKEPG